MSFPPSLLLLVTFIVCAQQPKSDIFDYPKIMPTDVRQMSAETGNRVTIKDITFAGVDGNEIPAYLVVPPGPGPFAAILYVHWLGLGPTSNRTQFLSEALHLANEGVISLLVEAPWADAGWFGGRKLEQDYNFSINEVKNLRRALDVLLGQPHVDDTRVGFVGHDFGAMYGAILTGIDSRVGAAVLVAGTPQFSNWFLLGTKLDETTRNEYSKKISELDPTNYIARRNSVPFLFQFGKHDEFIPEEKANEFYKSAPERKEILWYDTDHNLNDRAVVDRMKWLEKELGLHR